MTTCSVLIADSNTRLSRLIGELRAEEPGFRVLAVHSSNDEVLQVAQQRDPDIVLLSERLEDQPTEDLCVRLRAAAPGAALVMWSHDGRSRAKGESLADGVLERGITFRQLVRDLRRFATRPRTTRA